MCPIPNESPDFQIVEGLLQFIDIFPHVLSQISLGFWNDYREFKLSYFKSNVRTVEKSLGAHGTARRNLSYSCGRASHRC